MLKRLYRFIIDARRYMGWPERSSLMVMCVINAGMVAAHIIRALDPTQMRVMWLALAVVQGGVCVWLAAISYRPFPKKQRCIVTTAMLLGMQLQEDSDQSPITPKYWARNPAMKDVTDLQSWVNTQSRLYGRTPYDVATQWLANFYGEV